jgi:hypothetical protein
VRYSIRKHPFWGRWYVTAHFPVPRRAVHYDAQITQSVCQWFDTWDEALGYVISVFGWQV